MNPYCECGRKAERNGKCATCNRLDRKISTLKLPADNMPVNKVSENQGKLLQRYNKKRFTWLRGKKCLATFPHECTKDKELTVHHMQSRIGFADEYARENDIPLLLDERFWFPVCISAHRFITDHPKFAFENQYSFKKVTDKLFVKP